MAAIVISISKWGNFGNQLIQYMAALAMQRQLEGAIICGFDLPLLGIAARPVPPGNYRLIHIRSFADASIARLCELAALDDLHIIIDWHMQNMRLLLGPEHYAAMLPAPLESAPAFGDEHIVINIRADELLQGDVHWYPLVPVQFYTYIVSQTGKRPVFMGQTQPSKYMDALRQAFPDAEYLESGGPLKDFDIIRKARHIVVSISTFSWVAAWLSDARNIYLPLSGWLNPSHLREVDLLPTTDPRYRFYLFPLNYGLPEQQALAHHTTIDGLWKQISPAYLNYIVAASPFLPESLNDVAVPEQWYVHRYPLAAMEISEGFYRDARHHYVDVGRLRGYLQRPPRRAPPPLWPIISRGKRATQSSLSRWSIGDTAEADAMGAIDGRFDKDFAFHTAAEKNSWWSIDLGESHDIREIHLYNRISERVVEARATPLHAEISEDAERWITIFTIDTAEQFLSYDSPWCWSAAAATLARYVRLISRRDGPEVLHLRQVEIFGAPSRERH